MKAKRAGQIRYGIELARMNPDDAAGPLGSWLLPGLTIRAYVREDINVLKRMLRRDWISTAELRDNIHRDHPKVADDQESPMQQTGGM